MIPIGIDKTIVTIVIVGVTIVIVGVTIVIVGVTIVIVGVTSELCNRVLDWCLLLIIIFVILVTFAPLVLAA
jgi:hypothetical protein